jgi:hypothetical protein
MERVAKSRSKITPQNIDAVRSELETLISKNKLTLLLGGVSSKNANILPTARATSTTKSASATKTTSNTKTTASNPKSNANSQKTKQETTTTTTDEPPLKYEEFIYKAEGRFSDILNFLKQAETFPYPAKITQFYLGSPESVALSPHDRRTENLQLQFHLILYFHE